MSVVWEDAYGRLWQGDVRACLAALPAASVQCVVCSPPYWGLRSYGTEPQIWGGDPACDHTLPDGVGETPPPRLRNGQGVSTLEGGREKPGALWSAWVEAQGKAPMTGGSGPASAKQVTNAGSQFGNAWAEQSYRRDQAGNPPGPGLTGGRPPGPEPRGNGMVTSATCTRCGAWRGELGSEPIPDCAGWATGAPCGQCFICHLLEVFTAVRRVLRPDGVLFVVIGDSYAGSGKGPSNSIQPEASQIGGRRNLAQCSSGQAPTEWHSIPNGLKPKDLCGIPWRFALAMQAAGWWLRGDYIWSKPNPMPESVTDRCTRSHEYVFHFTKSERYYWDADAVREGFALNHHAPGNLGIYDPGRPDGTVMRANRGEGCNPAGRNVRSVWEIATEPFHGAHFACVDEATECLTAQGWKPHADLRPGELAAQYDLARGVLSWGAIEDVARYDVREQEMVVGHSRDLDMVLTPNHRCVIQRRHPRTRALQPPTIVRADALLASHAVPTAAPWDFEGDSTITGEWAELLGWYVAEGHEAKQTLAVEIYQSESANPGHVERIAALLRQVGAEWTMARAARLWRGRPAIAVAFRVTGYAAVRLRELAPAKRLPQSALLWADDRIQALMRGLVHGDGHTRADDGRASFIQRDRATADMVQALAIRLGWSATLARRPDGGSTVYFTKHRTRSFRGTNGRGAAPDRAPYTGVVWCPKLPLGTWVARRAGRVFITGNTYPTALVRRCIQAATSERGACGVCGAPWRRQTERIGGTSYATGKSAEKRAAGLATAFSGYDDGSSAPTFITTGWAPTCTCNGHFAVAPATGLVTDECVPHIPLDEHPVTPCIVLDPFSGSGTTLAVARQLGRVGWGVELNSDYVAMSIKRLQQMVLL